MFPSCTLVLLGLGGAVAGAALKLPEAPYTQRRGVLAAAAAATVFAARPPAAAHTGEVSRLVQALCASDLDECKEALEMMSKVDSSTTLPIAAHSTPSNRPKSIQLTPSHMTAAEKERIDWAGHSSLWGMAPPALQGERTYDEILTLAKQGRIATVQIAVQHDVLVATSPEGYRYALCIKDKDVPLLLADAMNDDGSMPFEVLPIDPIRQRVRDVAFSTLALSGSTGSAKAGSSEAA